MSGFRVLGCLGLNDSEIGKTVQGKIACIGTVAQLDQLLLRHVVDQIVIVVNAGKTLLNE